MSVLKNQSCESAYGEVLIRSMSADINIENVVLSGVKLVKSMDLSRIHTVENIEIALSVMELLRENMRRLTPAQMLSLFPLTSVRTYKRLYDKDCFYTTRMLHNHGMHTVLGDELDKILADYMCADIIRFQLIYWHLSEELVSMRTSIYSNGVCTEACGGLALA